MSEIFAMPRDSWLRYIMRLVLIATVAYLIWQVRLVLIVLLLGALLAYALRPLVLGFERLSLAGKQMRRGMAVALSFILLLAVLWALAVLLLPPLAHEVADLKANFPAHQQAFVGVWHSAREFYQRNFPDIVRNALDDSFTQFESRLNDLTTRVVSGTFRGLGFIAELFLVPILAFYFLADAQNLRRQVLFFVPERHQETFSRSLQGLSEIMYRYVVGQVILSLVAFAVVTIALWALHIKFWLLLGLFAGITRAIPVIGPLLGGIPVVAAVLAQSQSVPFGLWITIGFTLLHLFESKYLMPAVMGRQLGLHPVLIIFSLLVGAEFLGLIGMFIAVPVLAAVKFLIADYRAHAAVSYS